jgi:hypothetical protein
VCTYLHKDSAKVQKHFTSELLRWNRRISMIQQFASHTYAREIWTQIKKEEWASMRLGVVAHTCDPSFSGGWDRRVMVRGLSGQRLTRLYLKKKKKKTKPGMMVHICNHSYLGGRSRRIMVWGQPRQKHERLCLEKKREKAKVLESWLMCRALVKKHGVLSSRPSTRKKEKECTMSLKIETTQWTYAVYFATSSKRNKVPLW